jgi:hypothetical protein
MANERPDLDGWWVATRAELGGLPLPAEALSDLALRLRRGTFRFGTDEGWTVINQRARPRTLDMVPARGPSRGRVVPAILRAGAVRKSSRHPPERVASWPAIVASAPLWRSDGDVLTCVPVLQRRRHDSNGPDSGMGVLVLLWVPPKLRGATRCAADDEGGINSASSRVSPRTLVRYQTAPERIRPVADSETTPLHRRYIAAVGALI